MAFDPQSCCLTNQSLPSPLMLVIQDKVGIIVRRVARNRTARQEDLYLGVTVAAVPSRFKDTVPLTLLLLTDRWKVDAFVFCCCCFWLLGGLGSCEQGAHINSISKIEGPGASSANPAGLLSNNRGRIKCGIIRKGEDDYSECIIGQSISTGTLY